ISYEEHLYCDGFPVISEADDEEVIQFFLQGIKKDIGVDVPRELVPPAPTVDLYKPRKRKRVVKEAEKEVGKKVARKEINKDEKKEEKTENIKLVVKQEKAKKE
ncbi:hypothetical protein A2U01_0054697, partial [Trifolium medium]|nr:hypothetical protein [Trifolium medium]